MKSLLWIPLAVGLSSCQGAGTAESAAPRELGGRIVVPRVGLPVAEPAATPAAGLQVAPAGAAAPAAEGVPPAEPATPAEPVLSPPREDLPPEPAAPEPAAPEPAAPEPAAPEPAAPEPAASVPAANEPAPGVPVPGVPATSQPAPSQPVPGVPVPGGAPPAAAASPARPEVAAPAPADSSEITPPTEPPGQVAPAAPAQDEEARLNDELRRAQAERDYEKVRELSERLLALPHLSRARALHAERKYTEELEVLTRALELTPERPELLLASGTVRLLLADAGRPELYAAARDAFVRAGATPAALLGQSRAARALGLHREALDSARRALVLLSLRREERLSLEPAAEVLLAEAGLEVHRELRRAQRTAADELFSELVATLRARIQEKSTDSLAHARLAELYLDVGKLAEAQKAAVRGLDASPSDARLYELAARAAASLGGSPELLLLFRRLRDQFPNQPLVHWYLALEYFKSSAAGVLLAECESEAEQLGKAERWFHRVRELDSRYERTCQNHEALARALGAWRLVAADRLVEAEVVFLSMDDVAPGLVALDPASVDPQWAGRIGSGVAGLERIAARRRERKEFAAAAAVHATLARVLPQDAAQSRAAAEGAREAADTLLEEASLLEQASRGEVKDREKLKRLRKWAGVARERDFGTDKERAKFARESGVRRKASEDWFGRAWDQYLRAVELDPLDVRLATDAARVALRHTGRDLDRAETLLAGAVRIAEGRAANPDLKPDERNRLLVSWADAEQALGELELYVKDNPWAAETHLQNSVDVMPGARPQVSEQLLPRARARALEKSGAPAPGGDANPTGTPKRKDPR